MIRLTERVGDSKGVPFELVAMGSDGFQYSFEVYDQQRGESFVYFTTIEPVEIPGDDPKYPDTALSIVFQTAEHGETHINVSFKTAKTVFDTVWATIVDAIPRWPEPINALVFESRSDDRSRKTFYERLAKMLSKTLTGSTENYEVIDRSPHGLIRYVVLLDEEGAPVPPKDVFANLH